MPDSLSDRCAELLTGSYDCVDRIVLNAFFRMGHGLDLETIKTILGYQRRPRYRQRKSKSAQWEVAVEKATCDLTILKLHCGKLTLKIYTKGERVLRIEVVVHNTQGSSVGVRGGLAVLS